MVLFSILYRQTKAPASLIPIGPGFWMPIAAERHDAAVRYGWLAVSEHASQCQIHSAIHLRRIDNRTAPAAQVEGRRMFDRGMDNDQYYTFLRQAQRAASQESLDLWRGKIIQAFFSQYKRSAIGTVPSGHVAPLEADITAIFAPIAFVGSGNCNARNIKAPIFGKTALRQQKRQASFSAAKFDQLAAVTECRYQLQRSMTSRSPTPLPLLELAVPARLLQPDRSEDSPPGSIGDMLLHADCPLREKPGLLRGPFTITVEQIAC